MIKTVKAFPKTYELQAWAADCPYCGEEQFIVIPGHSECENCGKEFYADYKEGEEDND